MGSISLVLVYNDVIINNKIMKYSKCFIWIILISIQFILGSCSKEATSLEEEENKPIVEEVDDITKLKKELTIAVPMGGNSWVVNKVSLNKNMITDEGVTNWGNKSSVIRTFIRVNKAGKLSLGLMGKLTKGVSSVKITIGTESKEISIDNSQSAVIPVGRFIVSEPGYVQVDMQGLSKSDYYFGEVSHLLIGGEATSKGTDFIQNNDDRGFYWGRRGPSVHLNYSMPAGIGNAEWFYNELEVNEGDDVVGTYFMANGFGEGYFGIQVNSETERRILFSVWSSFKTDDPTKIPEDEKIILLKKGENVTAKEFGDEGSGGQSFRKFSWKSGTKYRFLLRAIPAKNNSTDYTAYFYAPKVGKWELIASFRRPKTTSYVTRPHSFLENFLTPMGQFTRKGNYSNQWVCSSEGKWTELIKAKFTADNTARKKARLDYAGGAEETSFYLKNCGFFTEKTTIDSYVTRKAVGKAPVIDFSKLP